MKAIVYDRFAFPLLAILFTGSSLLAQQQTVTIATVNNPAMIGTEKTLAQI